MAFSAVGALNYLDYVQARKDRDEELMNRREEIAFQYGLGKYSKSSKKSEENVAKNSTSIKVLQRDYNVSDDILAPIIASGDSTAATRLLETVNKAKEKFEADGLTMPESVVEEIFSGTVIGDQITAGEIDFEELNKFIGREMNEIYKTLLEQQKVTSSYVYIPDYTYVEMPTLEDLDRFEQRAIADNLARAQIELNSIISRTAELVSIADASNLNQEQLAEQDWLVARKQEIERALKANQKKDVTCIAGLYGTAYMQELRKYYPKFDNAPLNPALLREGQKEITVPNRSFAEILYRAGALKAGDVVRNLETNKLIPIGGN